MGEQDSSPAADLPDDDASARRMGEPKVERGASIEPLNKAVLIRRSKDMNPVAYITIVSIIQGAAFALAAQQAHDRVRAGASVVPVLAQAVAVLSILIFVFYFYMTASILFRRVPSFMDAAVPFIIGAFEIAPAFYFGEGLEWSVSVAAFFIVAALGLFMTDRWTPPDHFGKYPKAGQRFKTMLRQIVLAASAMTIAALFFGGLAARYTKDESMWASAAAIAVLAGTGTIAINMERNVVGIYRIYDVERAMFN